MSDAGDRTGAVLLRIDGEGDQTHLLVTGAGPMGPVAPHVHSVRRASKKAAVRFVFGKPTRRGTIWRLWAPPRTGDVYLASRMTAGETKISLHESGDWRHQIVNPHAPMTVEISSPPVDGRILHRWQRPAANDVGWALALTIVLPGTHLPVIPWDMPSTDDVRWCPAPTKRQQGEFDVWIVQPNLGYLLIPLPPKGRVAVVDALALGTGEVVVVVGRVGPIKPADIDDAERGTQTGPSRSWPQEPHMGPRTLATYPAHDGGAPIFYDLALTRSRADRIRVAVAVTRWRAWRALARVRLHFARRSPHGG